MTLHKFIFPLLLTLFSFQFIFSQTERERQDIVSEYDMEFLKDLSQSFSETYKRDKREAMAYALRNNIETIIPLENGGISILQKVLDDGTLIYFSTYNSGAANTINTDLVHPNGGSGLSLNGNGITLGIWDGGLVRSTHQELMNRVTQVDSPNNLNDHATHVSGTLIATGINLNAKGMAYEAELTAYDFNNDLSEMAQEAANGMLISNHSYGITPSSIPESVFGAYIFLAANVDQIVYNAPNYLPVFAAGNSRNVPVSQGGPFNPTKNGFDLISGKNLAKNILAVANVLEVNNYVDASSVVINNRSSWGPTDDGRIKPDISAKGTNTFSSEADADDAYDFNTGTSMAAPSVSGSLALLQQHHNNIYGHFLTAASMKALVIHTAREAGNAPGPDYKFGWGLMDTAAAASIISDNNFTSILEENTLNQLDTYSFTVEAIDPNEPLIATIVWTDPAGPIQADDATDDPTPRLVNDLDLRIISPDAFTTFKPWALTLSSPDLPAVKSDNIVDNVEKVEVENADGQFIIEVTHKGLLQNSSQDYTLVVSGIAESEFAINTDLPNRSFCADETALFDLDVNTTDSFSGNISFSQNGLPNALNVSFSPNSVNGEGSTDLSIDNLDAVATGDYPFTVTATSGSESFDFDMNLNIKPADALGNVSLVSPVNNGEATNLTPILDWDPVPNVDFYEVQLSTTSNFESVLYDMLTQDTEFQLEELDSNSVYFWRVKPVSECVQGAYTNTSFSVIDLLCNPMTFSQDTPVNIEDDSPDTVQSVVSISGLPLDKNVEDVNVALELSHTWLSDLVVTLTSPDGTVITLLDQACGDLDDVDVIFDDKGFSQSCNTTLPPALSGVTKPDEALSNLVGENLNGNWILTVEDMFDGDGGSIESFGIEVCYEETLSIEQETISSFSLYPNPTSGRVEVSFSQNMNKPVDVLVYDLNGKMLKNFSIKPNSTIFRFDVKDLSSGLYFVKLNTQNASAVKKLIVQ